MKSVGFRGFASLALLLISAHLIAGNNVWTPHGPAGVITALAVHPSEPSTIYAGSAGGVFTSTDAGLSWSPANQGLLSLRVRAIAADPSDPDTAYAATSTDSSAPFAGVFRTTSRGLEWRAAGVSERVSVVAVVVDPADSSKLFAAATLSDCIDPPSCTRFQTRGEVFRSTDSGMTWIATGLSREYPVTALVADPTRFDVLYVGTETGLFKSSDGGGSWVSASRGLERCPSVRALAIDPTQPRTLFVTTVRFFPRGVDCGGVLKTTDAAETWEATDLSYGYFPSVLIDPKTPNVVYAGAVRGGFFSGPPGIMRSTDGGSTWSPFQTGLSFAPSSIGRGVYEFASDPTGTHLYAGTENGIYRYTFCDDCRGPVLSNRRNPPPRSVAPRQ